MSLLPNNCSLKDQTFTAFIEKKLIEDFDVLKINPLNCDKALLPDLAVGRDVDISGLIEIESRQLIFNSQEIKKYQGTVYAVNKAINISFKKANMQEWFDNNLDLGYFKVDVSLQVGTIYDNNKFKIAKKIINKSSNIRSHFDGFNIKLLNKSTKQNMSIANNINISLSNQLKFKAQKCNFKIQGSLIWTI